MNYKNYYRLIKLIFIPFMIFIKIVGVLSKKQSNNLLIISAHVLNNLQKKNLYNGIIFDVSNKTLLSRAQRLIDKEKDTIWWISNLYSSEEIFLDIGANIGSYSLYACKLHKKIRVYSFEPESENYNILVRNIKSNKMSNQITSFNLALSNHNVIRQENLNLSSNTPGKSNHNISSINNDHSVTVDSSSILISSLDYLMKVKIIESFDHIKIDVDGAEAQIIEGMKLALNSKFIKTIIIEFNYTNEKIEEYVQLICSYNFILVKPPTEDQNNHFFIEKNYYLNKKKLFI